MLLLSVDSSAVTASASPSVRVAHDLDFRRNRFCGADGKRQYY